MSDLRFGIGDHVRVNTKSSREHDHGRTGRVVDIIGPDRGDDYIVRFDEDSPGRLRKTSFIDRSLDPLEPRFEVGDRVKVDRPDLPSHHGRTGTVTKVYGESLSVKQDDPEGFVSHTFYPPSWLTPYEDEPEPEGDTVESLLAEAAHLARTGRTDESHALVVVANARHDLT